MEPERISYHAKDGAGNQLLLLRAHAPAAPAILILPGWGLTADAYLELALGLHRNGFHVAVTDLRGLGNSTVRASRSQNFGYFDMLEHDVPAALGALRTHCVGCAVWLMGHQFGGQLAAMTVALQPDMAKGLVLLETGNPYFRGYPSPLQRLSGSILARLKAEVLGYLPARNPQALYVEPRRLVRDWSRIVRTGKLSVENCPIDFSAKLSRLRHPVLAVSFDGENQVPLASIEYFCKEFALARLEHWHLPGEQGHCSERDSRPASPWLAAPADLAAKLADWLRR